MEIITYSLRGDNADSNQYYRDIRSFADDFLRKSDPYVRTYVESFSDFMIRKGTEPVSSYEEYLLELLLLGVLWNVYGGDAVSLEEGSGQVLTRLAELRRQNSSWKPGIDFLRGILSTVFLSPDLYDHVEVVDPAMPQLEKLLDWLEATGEFVQEAKRLRLWQAYLETLNAKQASDLITAAILLAVWFEVYSEKRLGEYTRNVEQFLTCTRPKHYWREDVILCGRRRVEYHLNMLGAEIMNRAFRNGFSKTERKLVAVPACMCRKQRNECRMCEAEVGFRCTGCTVDCRVNELTKLGKEQHCIVRIIPHESSLQPKKGEAALLGPGTGAVGVACLLNLISGGWMLKGYGIPAQCVLLDYCGCNNHWHDSGIVTDINMEEFNRIVGK